jgi:hypothetical protein
VRVSDEAKNHFPSLPTRANQEAGLAPTPRYGRGSDLEVILEVIGSADRLPTCGRIFGRPRGKCGARRALEL